MIKFISIDPSLRNTALVYGHIVDGRIKLEGSAIINTIKNQNKQVRASSDLVERSRSLINGVRNYVAIHKPDICFGETPSGAQSFSSAISYAISCAIIAMVEPSPIEVSPQEVKNITGLKNPSKKEIIDLVESKYPNFLPRKKSGEILLSEAEHIADAIIVVEAGLKTKQYLQIKTLIENKSISSN